MWLDCYFCVIYYLCGRENFFDHNRSACIGVGYCGNFCSRFADDTIAVALCVGIFPQFATPL